MGYCVEIVETQCAVKAIESMRASVTNLPLYAQVMPTIADT